MATGDVHGLVHEQLRSCALLARHELERVGVDDVVLVVVVAVESGGRIHAEWGRHPDYPTAELVGRQVVDVVDEINRRGGVAEL